jgi:hypothetical protein
LSVFCGQYANRPRWRQETLARIFHPAAIMDNQNVKTTVESGTIKGYDGHHHVKGRKTSAYLIQIVMIRLMVGRLAS